MLSIDPFVGLDVLEHLCVFYRIETKQRLYVATLGFSELLEYSRLSSLIQSLKESRVKYVNPALVP